jgi:hypothetical protein
MYEEYADVFTVLSVMSDLLGVRTCWTFSQNTSRYFRLPSRCKWDIRSLGCYVAQISRKYFFTVCVIARSHVFGWLPWVPLRVFVLCTLFMHLETSQLLLLSSSTFLASQQFSCFQKQYGLTDQALLIHCSAKNCLTIRHVLCYCFLS